MKSFLIALSVVLLSTTAAYAHRPVVAYYPARWSRTMRRRWWPIRGRGDGLLRRPGGVLLGSGRGAESYVTAAPVVVGRQPAYYAAPGVVHPKVYIRGEPVRNAVCAVTP